jgi:hypothetical protein
MKKQKLLLNLIFLIIFSESFSQNSTITMPKLVFEGNKLAITYDIINKKKSDIFYVWVELRSQDSIPIRAAAFSGDVGDSIKSGKSKKIIWVPEEDAIYLDGDITVELKGEKYEKSFNKGSMVLLSSVIPGLGQTKISKGKPWWLLGVASYGALAGGLIVHKNYITTYDAYLTESDPITRGDLYDQSQKQMTISNVFFISAATLWVTNIIWVAATPNKYKPLQHVKFSVNSFSLNQSRTALLSLKVNF